MQRILGIMMLTLLVGIASTTRVVVITEEDKRAIQLRVEAIEHAQQGDFLVCAGDRGIETLLVARREKGYYTLILSGDMGNARTLDARMLAHDCREGVEVLSIHYPAYEKTLVAFVRGGGV